MMPYASIAQIIDRLGERQVVALTDRWCMGEVDNDRLTAALVAASVEIDSYIGTRYSIPVMVDPVPLTLVDVCIDVAVYKLSRGDGVLTDEVKVIYDRAVKWLEKVRDGKASVGIAAPLDGSAVVPAESGDVVLFTAGRAGVFGRGVADDTDS